MFLRFPYLHADVKVETWVELLDLAADIDQDSEKAAFS